MPLPTAADIAGLNRPHAVHLASANAGLSLSSPLESASDRLTLSGQAGQASAVSAVSWAAIFAGAAATASLSLILLVLGVGLGLSAVSPWAQAGVSASALGFSAIAWLSFTQLVSSGMGGYLAGRLRSRWLQAQRDEVYFRDTAHGFLSWAVATLVTAALLTGTIGTIVGGGVKASAALAGGAAAGSAAVAGNVLSSVDSAGPSGSMAYLMDSLLRKDAAANAALPPGILLTPVTTGSANSSGNEVAEITRIVLNTLPAPTLSAQDSRYISLLVAQRSGLPQADAEQRVREVYSKAQAQWTQAQTAAREAADTARKASAHAALWLFISLLLGAFVASLSATYGGRQRDL